MIDTWYDEKFEQWAACAKGDIEGMTLFFADTEIEAYEDCYGYMIYNGFIG